MLARALSLAAFALAVLLPGGARAAAPLLYVALGDSTAVGVGAEQGGGYPDRLARRLGASGVPVKLVNLGVSGATAADLRKAQLPRVMTGERPAFVTIGIGINDVMQGRPLREFARDLHVVADLVARTKATVVLSEIPNLDALRATSAVPGTRSLAGRVAAYNAAIRQVAERHGFLVADVEAASRRAFRPGAGLVGRDGFHPSARGYDVWADAMWPAVERALAPRVQARRAPAAVPER